MKKIAHTLPVISALLLFFAPAAAQTLRVERGNVAYCFNAISTGIMSFNQGKSLTVAGRDFDLSEFTHMSVVDEPVIDNLVEITYEDDKAYVNIAGNVAQYVDAFIEGADVTITQSEEVAESTCGEITYRLSGKSDNGSFSLSGSYKSSVELAGVTLTSGSGAAILIQNGKRVAVKVVEGTVNRLTDSATGDQKGCLSCSGHLEFKQKGELYVTGRKAHGIHSKEYVELKNAQITVVSAIKDGLNCNQYFLMESGSLTISDVGDDGLQCSFKDDTDRKAEDTGTITINGGNLDIAVTAKAAKGLKADGDFIIKGGEIKCTTSGHGLWDSTAGKTKASAGISADGTCLIDNGTLDLTSTGGGGKGISCDGVLTINGGSIKIVTSGGLYVYSNGQEYTNYTQNADRIASNNKSAAKGIKSDSNIFINGGKIDITTTGTNAEGIESKNILTINDGNIKVRAYDDAINSSSHLYIKGGTITAIATNNDGLDSNGNTEISGGTVMAFGGSSPECGIDVNSEQGYKLYITGGNVLGVGGGNSTPSSPSKPYITPSITITKGSTLSVASSSATLFTFEIPDDYTGSTSSGGGWGGGGRPGGGSGSMGGGGVLISLPDFTTGTSYTVTCGSSSANASAK